MKRKLTSLDTLLGVDRKAEDKAFRHQRNKTMMELAQKHADKILSWYKDSDGYWVTLKSGWQSEDGTECHSIHEDSVNEVIRVFRFVAPCDCSDCQIGDRS